MGNKFKKGFVREFNESRRQELEEIKIRQRHNISDEKVVVIEKSDTVKFLFKVFLNGIKTVAWITLIILAAVGMMCLVYPETRTEFFKIISEIFTGTKNLILG